MNATEQQHPAPAEDDAHDGAVAIVGMAGRFPGAQTVAELWRAQRAGRPGLREITEAERVAAGVPAGPGYVPVGGPVPGLEEFDAVAFGLADREAETLEPHHRLLLECSWEALESAGYPPVDPGPPVGLFAGCAFPDYLTRHLPDLAQQPDGGRLLAAGVERDSLTSLVSFKLGLGGPSLTVQTYCSTSLVAVHLACQSLLTFECDLALAGGAHLPLPQPAGYQHAVGDILSPTGRVASLDAAADGTVMGAGAAVVALKRLADALADGDQVHAVILGSAVNNDGRDRAGYAAPGVAGQAAVIETAQAVAGVAPASIDYVECHAVGTPLGDAIELAALSRVFAGPRDRPCVLGSAKPLIGHLDRAAGVTGLIRAALALRDGVLPATAGHTTPNPALADAADRLTVLTENQPWPAGPTPRRAGVSAFGVGGTNAHVVLAEPPGRPAPAPRPGPHLLTLSAADPAALETLTRRLRAELAERPADELADLAHTLQVSRGALPLRRAVVVTDHADALAALADPARWLDGRAGRRPPKVRLTGPTGPELAAATERLLGTAELADGLRRAGVTLADDGRETLDPAEATDDQAGWLVTALARLWLAGSRLDWAALHGGRGRRLPLPTYPFQRRRHWIDPVAGPGGELWLPTWRRRALPVHDLDRRLRLAGPWLLLVADPVGEALADRLLRAGAETAVVRPGAALAALPDGDFTVAGPADLARLPGELVGVPRTVLHAFGLAPGDDDPTASVATLTEALAADELTATATTVLLTTGALGVLGPDLTRPAHARLAARTGRHQVDLDAAADLDQVLAAALTPEAGPLAVRGPVTWQPHREPAELPPAGPPSGLTVLLAGADLALAGRLAAAGHELTRVPADAPPETLRRTVAEAVARWGRLDAAVLAPATEAAFHRLQAALGAHAPHARLALDPDPEVIAHARAARQRGAGRWLVAEGPAAAELPDRLLAAAGHLDHVLVGAAPADRPAATPTPRTSPAEPAEPAELAELTEPDERAIAALWRAALDRQEIGLDDNFFELGGRSAVAVELAERLGTAFGVRLPATTVLQHPTVRALADHLADLRSVNGDGVPTRTAS
ncbi:beta-ketoacyl synthase N-terminal-like domain-containing protein [Streptomyces sp. DSM 44915]|uniref:Beta-ketoacyl synthase N-terminal-like domain-containing protein n=1 Tax=Streptomyces chisholmiae TaxID=3075540 RepID=A0ABU2JS38_9ACTN|nr:beta-ketoacyl synthase N-terminal-like domain-containing protein [Streptomyces sp. DSM 44915]MDT0267334.1 beta-ketoacyl synthase N-terminal-like domain-containing protein [Streptomyces sp. DSM 44915]